MRRRQLQGCLPWFRCCQLATGSGCLRRQSLQLSAATREVSRCSQRAPARIACPAISWSSSFSPLYFGASRHVCSRGTTNERVESIRVCSRGRKKKHHETIVCTCNCQLVLAADLHVRKVARPVAAPVILEQLTRQHVRKLA